MRLLFLFATLLSATTAAAQDQGQSLNKGVIYGKVIARDGTPAKGLTLNATPLGVVLAMALPWTKTNEAGAYRFEHLPWARYTVYAEDEAAGYSGFSTGSGGASPTEVNLAAGHPVAELNINLPPPAGFLLLRLANRRTGSSISGGQVTVLSKTPRRAILGGSLSSTQPILVPSDKDLLLLHVTSWGYREWDQSAGAEKPLRIAPGNRLALDVQLEPSNPLTQRIAASDPKSYQGIRDAKDWRNPDLIVRPDGIYVAGVTDPRSSFSVDAATAFLESLPVTAWPYGLVIAIQDNSIVGSESDEPRIEAIRNLLARRLSDLGVMVDLWPSG
jgi:hypothetical protein